MVKFTSNMLEQFGHDISKEFKGKIAYNKT
jgi:hypothetical protein